MTGGDGNGRTDAKEIGLILGKLEGIYRSQGDLQRSLEETNRSLDTLCEAIAEINTAIAVMRSQQEIKDRELAALRARVEAKSSGTADLSRNSWKGAAVRYGGAGGLGASILAALLKLFGVKIGGSGQ